MKRLLTLTTGICLTASLALAEAPKMKMTTDIPVDITTPATVETSIGTLNYFDGIPDNATIETLYDYMDTARAVQACPSAEFLGPKAA